MFADFKTMPSDSKIWIYQADRTLNPIEVQQINASVKQFISNWESHGHSLNASFLLLHDLFLIIAVDQKQFMASGCSIDKSLALVQNLEKDLNIRLLDRTNIAVRMHDGIKLVPQKELKKMIEMGVITPQTPVFNNIIAELSELNNTWEVAAKQSWIGRYFN
jgi:hypothetical protein